MFERGAPLAEQSKVLELGPGAMPPAARKDPLRHRRPQRTEYRSNSFPLSDKIVFSSKLTQANALSTEWEFEPGVKETVNKRQQQPRW